MNLTLIRNTARKAVTLSLILLLSGCLSPRYFFNSSVDVTNNPGWWGPLAKGEVLRLKQDTFLNFEQITLHPYKFTDSYNSSVLFGGTITIERLKANPAAYWPELRFLPKDTRLRCVKLERFYSFEYSTYVVNAEVLDGEFKGHI